MMSLSKNLGEKTCAIAKIAIPLHRFYGESLAQLVEHNTFNVGVMGSSPMRFTTTQIGAMYWYSQYIAFFLL